jgi:hypothetical protein
MTKRSIALCGAVLVFAGCGGSDPGGSGAGTASGTVGGTSLTVAEATSITYSGPVCTSGGEQSASLLILLTSFSGLCSAGQSGSAVPNGSMLILSIGNNGDSAQPAIGPGTYTVQLTSDPLMIGLFETVAAGCPSSQSLTGSGTVTLTSVTSSGVSGSYNLSFLDGTGTPNGSLSGSFTTSNCPLTAAQYCATSNSHC